MDAVTDLKWLAERFKGILDLAPQLEDYASLTSRVTELTKVVENKKAEFIAYDEKVKDQIAAYISAQEKQAQEKEAHKTILDRVLAEAKQKAKEIVNTAYDEVSQLRKAFAEERQGLENKIATLKEEVQAQHSEVKTAKELLAQAKAALQNFKNSI
jgi:chromosome segregation ATPase